MRVPLICTALFLGACAVSSRPAPPPAAEAVVDQPAPLPVRDVSIRGFVTDAQSGQPIAAAQVEIVGTRFGNITNDSGEYTIRTSGALTSRVDVRAVSIGYGAQIREVALVGDPVRVDFRLEPTQVEIQALVIEGQRNPLVPRDQVSSRAMITGAYTPSGHPDYNREQYARIFENRFLSPASVPLSTFGADVDRASFANVRRFLTQGQLPPPDAVRVEELINYFHYDYPEPTGDVPFSVTTELAPAPWHAGHQLLRIGIQTRRVEAADLPPSNLVFLLDVSGSMRSPDKLPLVKSAFPLLVDQLRPQDRVAIVVYAGAAGVVLPSTSGDRKLDILSAIARLEAGGSTAGGQGLRLAYRVARENFIDGGNNRVILATDGDFNVGVSSDAEMIRLVEEERGSGVFLSVLGFGTGNLQDAKMESIADHGNGNYAYVDDILEARKVFVEEIGATLLTVAKDVKLQIEFNPARVAGYRLIGYENRLLQDHEFDDDSIDAGDLGAGHSVTALYEIIPVGVTSDVEIHAVADLRYQERTANGSASNELGFVRIRYKEPTGDTSLLLEVPVASRPGTASADLRLAAAAAGFGMLLRDSPHRGTASFDMIASLARSAVDEDRFGYRADFVELLERYRTVAANTGRPGGR